MSAECFDFSSSEHTGQIKARVRERNQNMEIELNKIGLHVLSSTCVSVHDMSVYRDMQAESCS